MKTCDVVNATTKAWIPGRKKPILMVVNYATLNDDDDRNESLIIPFEMMRHGISIDLIPKQFGGEGGMMVEDEEIPFKWNGEQLFLKLAKPNEGELEELEIFELNTLSPDMTLKPATCRRKKKIRKHDELPLTEWQKRFAMLLEEAIKRTLKNSTNFYINVKVKNCQDPRQHFKYRFP
eukprot:12151368-Ditylum_brightwellii.AAC.1